MLRTTRGARTQPVEEASPEWAGNEPADEQLAGWLGHLGIAEESEEDDDGDENGEFPTIIEVFCHGSSRGNGQPGATGAYACVFPEYPRLNSVVPVGADQSPTNQQMAYKAAIHAIEIVNAEFAGAHPVSVQIVTNNKVMNKSMNEWNEDWSSNGGRRINSNRRVKNWELITTVEDVLRPGQIVAWLHYDTDFVGADKLRALKYHEQASRDARRAAPARP